MKKRTFRAVSITLQGVPVVIADDSSKRCYYSDRVDGLFHFYDPERFGQPSSIEDDAGDDESLFIDEYSRTTSPEQQTTLRTLKALRQLREWGRSVSRKPEAKVFENGRADR